MQQPPTSPVKHAFPILTAVLALAGPSAVATAVAGTSGEGVDVHFSGKVVETKGVSGIPIGTPLSGSYRFDPTAQDFNPADKALGLYEAVVAFELKVGEMEYHADTGVIGILNDSRRFGGKVDAYTLTCGPPLIGPPIGDLPPFQMDMNLADTSASLFDDVALPARIDGKDLDIKTPTRGLQTGGHLLFRDSASGKVGDIGFAVETLEVVDSDMAHDSAAGPDADTR